MSNKIWENFIITVGHRNSIGFILSGHLVSNSENRDLKIIENLSQTELPQDTPEEIKKIITVLDSFSMRKIYKIFNTDKKLSEKDFFTKLSQQDVELRIRPFVEQRINGLFKLIKEKHVPIYIKNHGSNLVSQSDKLEIVPEPVSTIFNIEKTEEGTKYYLSVLQDDKNRSLLVKPQIVLSNQPCIIVLENEILFFKDVDAKKLQAFFTKESISVPVSSEKIWYEKFARKAINEYTVNAKGFEIIQEQPEIKPILILEKDWKRKYVFLLKFRYDKHLFLYGDKKNSIVKLSETEEISFTELRRNLEFEEGFERKLTDAGFSKSSVSGFVIDDDENIENQRNNTINWLNENFETLENMGFEVEQSFFERSYFTQKMKLDLKVSKRQDWFDIKATVIFGEFTIPFIKLRPNLISGNREFVLPDKSIAIIPEEWFEKYANLLKFAKSDTDDAFSVEDVHYTVLEDIEGIDRSIFKRLLKINANDISNYKLPENSTAVLRPYQAEGYAWLCALKENNLGGCLADDMGLGKTLQTITLLQKIAEESDFNIEEVNQTSEQQLSIFDTPKDNIQRSGKTNLIVMPVSLIHNWANEIKKFAPELRVLVYTGNTRGKFLPLFKDFDVILAGYGIVRNDIEKLSKFNFYYTILDESQFIKNPDSATYQALMLLKTKNKLILTGTPIENSLTDLWAQMNFINKGMLGGLAFFNDTYKYSIEKEDDIRKSKHLKKLVRPFILRRTKEEVATDLPALTEQIVYCEMTELQASIYEKEKSKIRNEILGTGSNKKAHVNSMLIINALTKLRQLANHPKLIEPDTDIESGKFNDVVQTINELVSENHKILIFSSFVKHLKLFAKYFEDNNLKYSILTGQTKNREEVVTEFQSNPENKLFLISIKAGGTGLNLTQADYVLILDPWWNPAVEKQAVNRAHRIGQDKKVMVYRYISLQTIEEKINNLQKKKLELSDSILNSRAVMDLFNEKDILDFFE